MTVTTTQMQREILEIPDAVERLLSRGSAAITHAAAASRSANPGFAITVARGSSDHASTFLKYCAELLLGLPVASVGPSIASIYDRPVTMTGGLCLSVSQSGQSPDIVAMTASARSSGALTLALTNDASSPLAEACEHPIDICAGPEHSVAATKTFVNSAVAGLMLLADWAQDDVLRRALQGLPSRLAQATALDWPEVRAAIGQEQSLFTLGRGPSLAMSHEAALKFKETCQIHAESYSSAEVLHGPVSIVQEGFPVLCFAAEDAAEQALAQVADNIAAKGAQVFATSDHNQVANRLPHVRSGHPLCDPLLLIVSFYAMVERIAAERGLCVDQPRHLKKVTETV